MEKIDKKIARVYSPVGYEELLHEDVLGVRFRCSDISFLFNQERINKLSPLVVEDLVSRIKKSTPSLKASDDVLRAAVKSRYCQSITDLSNFSRQIEAEMDSLVKDVESRQAAIDAAQAAAAASPSGSEPAQASV